MRNFDELFFFFCDLFIMMNYLVACWVIMFHSPLPVKGWMDSRGILSFFLHA